MATPVGIRIRVGVAVVHDARILLVPHYNTDAGPVQWCIPGGQLKHGERLEEAAKREFEEETGLRVHNCHLLDVSEVLLPERDYHSITITFAGSVEGGELRPEPNHRHGQKNPRWISREELGHLAYHPPGSVEKAFDLYEGIQPPGALGENGR